MVQVHLIDAQGELVGPVTVTKIIKSDRDWQSQLTQEQFRIARGQGTEAPFCGRLLDNHQQGIYLCVCCRLPLFSSDAKFQSGTGWPSFFQPIARPNVLLRPDNSHGMIRTEILCARCDAHLGHVFDDGPKPTGMRFCLNSESLTFVSAPYPPTPDVPTGLGPPTSQPAANDGSLKQAVFAGGCFWCTEAVFEQLHGVSSVVSGYSGGTAATANYQAVCTGVTGHAEAIQITYDPAKISYDSLLEVFFAAHDPTQLNRQGADVGTQYRSAIFYADETQKSAAKAFIDRLNADRLASRRIVTTLEPLKEFFPAETYHQDYACRNPNQPYIQSQAAPKIEKTKKLFPQWLRKEPDGSK